MVRPLTGAIGAVLFLLAGCSGDRPALDLRKDPVGIETAASGDTLARMHAATVMILAPRGRGSGFVVAPGLVATAAHVVVGGGPLQVAPEGGQPAAATLAWRPQTRDIAIVSAPDLNGTAIAPLRCGLPPQWQEPITAIGHPDGAPFVVATRGIVASWADPDGDYWVDLVVLPGNSGSAIWDARGEVIGIATRRHLLQNLLPLPIPTGLGWFAPIGELCEQLATMVPVTGPR